MTDDAVAFYASELVSIARVLEQLEAISKQLVADKSDIAMGIGSIEVYDTNANIVGKIEMTDIDVWQFFPAKELQSI